MKIIKNLLLLICGSFVAGVGLNLFLEPFGIAPGGLSGVAVLISHIAGDIIPVGLLTFLLNIPLFIPGYKYLGREFILKSVIGTVMFSVAIDVTSFFVGKLQGEDILLYALWGGAAIGLGFGMIFRGGASTGGTDIAARLLQRKISLLTIGQAVLWFDIIFLVIVAVVYRSVESAFYTGIAVFVSSKVVDFVEAGINYAKEVCVFTEKPDGIAQEIMSKLERGVSKVDAEGMYTGNKKYMLICVVYNRQVSEVRHIVDKYDPDAFITIKEVRETKGLSD
ncbi:MAG: YitT family protein [Clostridia bacterium]|nr:YitT family protein [Clostridia bacterium]